MYKVKYVFPSGHVETIEVEGWPVELDGWDIEPAEGYEPQDGWSIECVCALPLGVVLEVWKRDRV